MGNLILHPSKCILKILSFTQFSLILCALGISYKQDLNLLENFYLSQIISSSTNIETAKPTSYQAWVECLSRVAWSLILSQQWYLKNGPGFKSHPVLRALLLHLTIFMSSSHQSIHSYSCFLLPHKLRKIWSVILRFCRDQRHHNRRFPRRHRRRRPGPFERKKRVSRRTAKWCRAL